METAWMAFINKQGDILRSAKKTKLLSQMKNQAV